MVAKEKKEFQTTVKMSISLRNSAKKAADDLGISLMEYIRRATQEKLDRDQESKIDITNMTNEEFDERIIKVLKRLKEDKEA